MSIRRSTTASNVEIKESDVARSTCCGASGGGRPGTSTDRVGDQADPHPDQHRGFYCQKRPLASHRKSCAVPGRCCARRGSTSFELKKSARRRPPPSSRRNKTDIGFGHQNPLLRAAALPDGEGPAPPACRPRTPAGVLDGGPRPVHGGDAFAATRLRHRARPRWEGRGVVSELCF